MSKSMTLLKGLRKTKAGAILTFKGHIIILRFKKGDKNKIRRFQDNFLSAGADWLRWSF